MDIDQRNVENYISLYPMATVIKERETRNLILNRTIYREIVASKRRFVIIKRDPLKIGPESYVNAILGRRYRQRT